MFSLRLAMASLAAGVNQRLALRVDNANGSDFIH